MHSSPRFAVSPSPIGDILSVFVDDALVWLHPVHGSVDADLERTALRLHAAPAPDEGPAAAVVGEQLEAYFCGERERFDLELDWRFVTGFTRTALQAVCEIPYGQTAGYGEVAIAAGSPRAARAVGTACATTPFSIVVPVHRVVRADGSLGEYGGRPEIKQFLIDLERAG